MVEARVVGPIALVGSGEFLDGMVPVDRELLRGRTPRAVHLPTAAAQEGDASIGRWVRMGQRHFRRLGVPCTPLLVLERADADDPVVAAEILGAGLVYLSGGDPGYLASTLQDTRAGEAIVRAWEGGAAVAGCSAGAMALVERVPDVRRPEVPVVPGLGLVHGMAVIPHFDRFKEWRPNALTGILEMVGPGVRVVGIDEDTALIGGDAGWTVWGRQRAWLISPDGSRRPFDAGARLDLQVA
ncbi:MAG: hypothetical protein E6J20_21025 [Chloroflexi bacterium]|nr:MAG: hypothetical protein E6J20_21025 [Chloroflexota bacterium]